MNNNIEEEIRRQRRASKRKEEARRQRKRQWYLRLFVRLGIPAIIILAIVIIGVCKLVSHIDNKTSESSEETSAFATMEKTLEEPPEIEEVIEEPTPKETIVYTAASDSNTRGLPSDVVSTYGILIDLDGDKIISQKDSKTRISPASMTKILTVLVAAENVENLDDTVTITLEYTDYSYKNDLSAVGFAENEVVTVRDLFYGTILPSGGDAALALACYVAGSEEAFVELMNEKLKELELSDTTHFTNCVGMYDDNHYSTVYDMAMIIHAAIDNELCREVMSAHTYTTSSTSQHPDGITISNWFLRRIEDKDCGLTVECAKTGFVVQSRNCAASYAHDNNGHGYICVTADSSSSWRCIYDHVSIYKNMANPGSSLSENSSSQNS